ncbi:ABC transporter ATP-binding protein [Umezawaea tangerina]|uniref:ABC-2 type transport system ATP-binding protein n=1 Tax=Umezawaea tangerina TaxID=84725 RepID=A0A2T0T4C7_9PSEU|nr:ABC transporter ATP-binding protein [Umezawaea tangerina]PRY40491.1 ABC-2 type transport system ATP-binding protein [Umezawaea tangerina]
MIAVSASGLTRTFQGGGQALERFTFEVPRGEVHGLLGPNGAGKTTLCRILSTVLLPTGGSASVLGRDVVRDAAHVRRSVGVVFGGDRGVYGRLTARQNLNFWAALHGLSGRALRERVAVLLERTGLTGRADERVDHFSRGMKQRLHLARGLVADPPVLILDEPTAGMDPIAAHEFRDLVAQLRDDGRTVLLTTHDTAEAEAVCDRVTLMRRGAVLATGSPSSVAGLVTSQDRISASGVPAAVVAELVARPEVVVLDGSGGDRVELETSGDTTGEVLHLLVDAGVTRLVRGRPSLEEAYLRLLRRQGMAVDR